MTPVKKSDWINKLYYGDNLDILRKHIADDSVDLIYLDPPFNSKANYNILFKSPSGSESASQIDAFDDTWQWDDTISGMAVRDVKKSGYNDVADMLESMLGFLGKNDMTAYLAMMAVRLIELHRVLKPTGSLYLHCDTTASHYLKLLLDAVFSPKYFGNEITWKRSQPKGHAKRNFANSRDIIFRYTKSDTFAFNPVYKPLDQSYIDKFYRFKDDDGRLYRLGDLTNPNKNRPNLTYEFLGVHRVWRWTRERMQEAYDAGLVIQSKAGAVPCYKRYLDQSKGAMITDNWDDIEHLHGANHESLGYPTQKPVALLERILQTSSNKGDVVLDPFCGCGTTTHAAQKLGRKWIGIDITPIAINLIETRLFDAFGKKAKFDVLGLPKDIDGARKLFDDDTTTKKIFEKWACSQIKAYPQNQGKKGADGGIDGFFWFGKEDEHKAIVSVKGGKNVGVAMVRDLDAVVTEQNAAIGIFLTLTPPTEPMIVWAKKAGVFKDKNLEKTVPRIQIITIEDALKDKENAVKLPIGRGITYKQAAHEETPATIEDLENLLDN